VAWEKESIIILVKAAPNWSKKYKKYQICTAGISQDDGWRRLYPFPEKNMIKKNIHVWDIIEVEASKPSDDRRPESRKIKPESIVKRGHLESRRERRDFLDRITEQSLEIPLNERRTMTLIRPSIDAFRIVKRPPEPKQFTLEGKTFKLRPYGDVGLYYRWSCPKSCRYCQERPHVMECFDWGANILYKRYPNEEEAKVKVRHKCYYEMKYENDTWFALGTHSLRPWKRWMIVGLLWMKKQEQPQPLTNFINMAN